MVRYFKSDFSVIQETQKKWAKQDEIFHLSAVIAHWWNNIWVLLEFPIGIPLRGIVRNDSRFSRKNVTLSALSWHGTLAYIKIQHLREILKHGVLCPRWSLQGCKDSVVNQGYDSINERLLEITVTFYLKHVCSEVQSI